MTISYLSMMTYSHILPPAFSISPPQLFLHPAQHISPPTSILFLSLSGNPLNTGSAYHTCTGAWQSNGSWQSYQWPHIQKSLALSFLETFNHAQLLRKGWDLEIIYPSRPEICLAWPCAGTPAAVSSRVPRKQYLTALLTIHWLLHSFCLLLHNVSWALVVKGLT